MPLSLPNGVSGLKAAGDKVEYTQEMINEYIRCKTDVIYFAEKYYYIVTLDQGKRLIKLADHQKRLLKGLVEPEDPERRHACILSARQSYKTTTTNIYLLHYALFNDDKEIAVLANKERTAIKIMKRLKTAYEKLPLFLQQGIVNGGWNKKTIEFENGTTITASATSSSAIRSDSCNLLFMDEFAFVPDNIAGDFMASVYPTIISGQTTKMIIVSTPNGMNHFFDIWTDAVRGRNSFQPMRIHWWEVEGRNEKWKQQVIHDIGLQKWLQEFECKFLGSASTLIDANVLEHIETQDPVDYKWSGAFMIYEPPIQGEEYLIAADTGKGIGKDASVIQVCKVLGMNELVQVAKYWNNRIAPHDFASIVDQVSQYYNMAQILAENNGKEGGVMCHTLWYHLNCDRLVNPNVKDVGILSTVKSKFRANMALKKYMENEWIAICDSRTRTELSKYTEKKPNVFAADNKEDHDDCVTSLIWLVYFSEMEIINCIDIAFDPETKAVIRDDKRTMMGQGSPDGWGTPLAILDSDVPDPSETPEYGILDPGWMWPS